MRTLISTVLALLISVGVLLVSLMTPATFPVHAMGVPQHRLPLMHVCGAPRPGHAACDALTVGSTRSFRPATPASGIMTPADFHSAYLLPNTAGTPQTVAIVDAYGDSTVRADLAAFDTFYNLPSCDTSCLTVVDQNGGTNLPPTDSGWQVETALDVETVHSICQNCHILLVQASSSSFDDLAAAEDTAARLGATEISNSWGGAEGSGGTDEPFHHAGIVITASTGDSGYGASFPATVPSVIAVGGTSIGMNANGTAASETAWKGSGSGCSALEGAPARQRALANWGATGCKSKRSIADVSADADPYTGVNVYAAGSWEQVGGTSLSSPVIASTYALAGGVASSVNPADTLYAHAGSLYDVNEGSNGSCSTVECHAVPGYDGPTGLGSPRGLVPFGGSSVPPTPVPTGQPVPSPTSTPAPVPTNTPTPRPTATPKPRTHYCAWWSSKQHRCFWWRHV